MAILKGTSGNNTLSGTTGDDLFKIQQGGDDDVFGDAGNDIFKLNAALTTADSIDGGADSDRVDLKGDYSSGLTFGAATITNIEILRLAGAFDYDLTMHDGNVAAGERLTVNAGPLGSGHHLVFDGSAEFDGAFTVYASAGDDDISGGAGDDMFFLQRGGDDTASGRGGNDDFRLGASLTAAATLDGGAGSDTVNLDGDYFGGNALVFGATTMVKVERLNLASGNDYSLTMHSDTVIGGQLLTVDASTLGAGDRLVFDGTTAAGGTFHITGGAANDSLVGGNWDDTFDLTHGGNDFVETRYGGDSIFMGDTLTAADSIHGNYAFTTLYLDGDYTAGVTFTADTVTNVGNIALAAGHSYNLTTADLTVTGFTMTVNGSLLGAGDTLTFNGSAETVSSYDLIGGAGTDVLTGGGGADTFDLAQGGDDSISGGAGADAFSLGSTFTTSDHISGGAGTDTMNLSGDYSPGLSIGSGNLNGVEVISVAAGFSYNLTTADDVVGFSDTLTVDASALGASHTLTFNGSAETGNNLTMIGGAGNDVLTGGAQSDTVDAGAGIDDISGGGGADSLSGGADIDRFHYGAVAQSASTTHDTITDFDAADDFFDLHVAVVGYDGQVNSGVAINEATFDANLTVATAGAFALAPAGAHAIVLHAGANGGDLDGHSYVIVDVNGDAAYTATLDYVIDLTGAANLASLGVSNFI